jgi:transketolase
VGMAIAERWLGARFNRPRFEVVDHYTFVIACDGALMDGVSHEACSLAGHLGLSKPIVLYDDNGISIGGPTTLAFTEDVLARFPGYGWHTQRIDGHDCTAVETPIAGAQAQTNKPSLIACRTHIGFGSANRQDSAIANAKLAYKLYLGSVANARWQALALGQYQHEERELLGRAVH